MVDILEQEQLKRNEGIVLNWSKKISETGEVGEIDLDLLKSVLEGHGATFEISPEAHKSLSKYSNPSKEKGIIAVWKGKNRLDEMIAFIRNDFLPEAEKKYNREFPDLYDPKTQTYDKRSTTNFAGSLQFFTSLTALASGDRAFEDTVIEGETIHGFRTQTQKRAVKGLQWARGEEYKPSTNPPFPPGLPSAVVEKIISW